MSNNAMPRPASVTIVVVLLWLNAILTILGGLALVFGADNAGVRDQFNGNADTARFGGFGLLLIGIIVALVALGLGKGSGFLRIIITVIVLFRIGADIWLILNSSLDAGALFSMAINFLILFLLWNAKANAFFASR